MKLMASHLQRQKKASKAAQQVQQRNCDFHKITSEFGFRFLFPQPKSRLASSTAVDRERFLQHK